MSDAGPGGAIAPRSAIEVVAALVWRDGRLLVTQRPAGSHLAGTWEFPGGKIEPGESAAEALAREVMEEVELVIEVGALRHELVHAYPEKTVRLYFFDCRWVSGEARHVGVANHRWIERTELHTLEFPPADRQLLAELDARFEPARLEADADADRSL